MIHYILIRNENFTSDATYNRVRLIYEGFLKNDVKAKLHLLVIPNRLTLFKKMAIYVSFLFKFLSLFVAVNKKDVVIMYGNTFYYYLYPLFARKTNLVIEHNDYPFHEIVNNIPKSNEKWSKKNLNYLKYASSVITCSSFLKEYFGQYVKEIHICPLVVNVNEFIVSTKEATRIDEYIAYCGNINNEKDGVLILLESYKLFHDDHPSVGLVLIGEGEKEFVEELKMKILNYGLQGSVNLVGVIPHSEVSDWLTNATILALARPNSRQAEGGIPSKVGEYLASGVPCVITSTGDLPNYLNDGVDCFLCTPNSIESFYQRLEDCYNSNREQIGKMGRKAAMQFDNVIQAEKLIVFLESKYNISIEKKL